MYKSSHKNLRASQRRQQRDRRRAAHRKRILIGAAMIVCLLTCTVHALESSSALLSNDTSVEPPRSAENAPAAIPSSKAPAPAQVPVDTSLKPPESAASAPAAIASSETTLPPAAASNTPGSTENDWKLLLVNAWNPLPEDFAISLTQLKNGHAVDERCYPDLQAMMDDCRAAGLKPVICSSYRTQAKQEQLFNHAVNQYLAKGYSDADARAEAGKSVAIPGTGEHQLGLAVDIVDLSNQNLNESQEKTAVQKWLMENSWRYGFILRYPNGKSDITGIIYEPWHYRYVGKDAAKEIYEQEICLEEYVTQ